MSTYVKLPRKTPKTAYESETRSVDRAIIILAALCESESGAMSLTELSRAANLAPSTALRLMRTMVNLEFLTREDDGLYRAGPLLNQLGINSFKKLSINKLCEQEMIDLAESTGDSVYLCVPGHNDISLYVQKIEGSNPVRHSSKVGRTLPYANTSAGRLFRGETPAEGYLFVKGAIEAETSSVAVAIRNGETTEAVLSIIGPTARITENAHHYGNLLRDAAARLNEKLRQESASQDSASHESGSQNPED